MNARGPGHGRRRAPGRPRAARLAPVALAVLMPGCAAQLAQEPATVLPAYEPVTVEVPPVSDSARVSEPAGAPDLPRGDAAALGMAPARLAELDRLVFGGIRQGVSPGMSLAVGRRGELARIRGYGRVDWDPLSPAVTDSTLYDLASLTKVVGTTAAVMLLHDDGLLELDAPVSRYLADWGGSPAKESVTLRHLLTHTSGLPAWRALHSEPGMTGKAAYFHRIAELRLDYPPGTRTVYSDLGMILAQAVVEAVAGRPIERLLKDRIYGPLGMTDTHYSPLQLAEAPLLASGGMRGAAADDGGGLAPQLPTLQPLLNRIAPTERMDSSGRLKHGFVHDENAEAMNGVAGHAGLFSSARDLAVFAQLLLNDGEYAGQRVFRPGTVATFTAAQDSGSSRALGWDTPSDRSSAGALFSARSFGHTGFTGTSLWIDPERELFVVLLTNRVNPTRSNQRHIPFRRAVHDLVQQAVSDAAAGVAGPDAGAAGPSDAEEDPAPWR